MVAAAPVAAVALAILLATAVAAVAAVSVDQVAEVLRRSAVGTEWADRSGEGPAEPAWAAAGGLLLSQRPLGAEASWLVCASRLTNPAMCSPHGG